MWGQKQTRAGFFTNQLKTSSLKRSRDDQESSLGPEKGRSRLHTAHTLHGSHPPLQRALSTARRASHTPSPVAPTTKVQLSS